MSTHMRPVTPIGTQNSITIPAIASVLPGTTRLPTASASTGMTINSTNSAASRDRGWRMTASRSREVVARALWNVMKANMSSTAGAIQENWSGNSTPTSMHKGAAAAMWRPMNAPMANHGFVALPACTVAIPSIAFRPMAPHSHEAVAASPLPRASQTSRAPFRQRVRPFGRRAVHQAKPQQSLP